MKDGKDTTKRAPAPLAERMRPATLSEFIGQRDVVGAKTPLLRAVESGTLPLNRVAKTDYVLLKEQATKAIEQLRSEGGWDKG